MNKEQVLIRLAAIAEEKRRLSNEISSATGGQRRRMDWGWRDLEQEEARLRGQLGAFQE
jgi:hypothetical protein